MERVINQPAISRVGAPRNLLMGLRRWYRELRMSNALEALDDAALKDIGIYRCAIPWIARTQCASGENEDARIDIRLGRGIATGAQRLREQVLPNP